MHEAELDRLGLECTKLNQINLQWLRRQSIPNNHKQIQKQTKKKKWNNFPHSENRLEGGKENIWFLNHKLWLQTSYVWMSENSVLSANFLFCTTAQMGYSCLIQNPNSKASSWLGRSRALSSTGNFTSLSFLFFYFVFVLGVWGFFCLFVLCVWGRGISHCSFKKWIP